MNCPFCSVDESRIACRNDCVIVIWDGFPVLSGHLLIISSRSCDDLGQPNPFKKPATWSCKLIRLKGSSRNASKLNGFYVGFNQRPLQQVIPGLSLPSSH